MDSDLDLVDVDLIVEPASCLTCREAVKPPKCRLGVCECRLDGSLNAVSHHCASWAWMGERPTRLVGVQRYGAVTRTETVIFDRL